MYTVFNYINNSTNLLIKSKRIKKNSQGNKSFYILHAIILSRLLAKVIIIKYNSKKGLLTIQRMNYGWKCWNNVCQKKLVLSHYFAPLLFNKRSNFINLSLFNRGVIYISLACTTSISGWFFISTKIIQARERFWALPPTHTHNHSLAWKILVSIKKKSPLDFVS